MFPILASRFRFGYVVQVKETKEEQKETNERVFRERSHLIDAAIVRIMKSRQQLTHRELVSETMDALSNIFSADVSFRNLY